MRKFRTLNNIIKGSGVTPIMLSLLSIMLIGALFLLIVEPEITTYGDALWLCFTTVTTIGYGDFYATTTIGRLISAILAVYGILLIAIITGIAVNYFGEIRKLSSNQEVKKLVDRMKNLEHLSVEEIKEIEELAIKYEQEFQAFLHDTNSQQLYDKLGELEGMSRDDLAELSKKIRDRR